VNFDAPTPPSIIKHLGFTNVCGKQVMPDNQASMKTKPNKKASASNYADTAEPFEVPETFALLGFTSTRNPAKPSEIRFEDFHSGLTFNLTPAPIWEDVGVLAQAFRAAYNAGRAAERSDLLEELLS
jgi:hypothetical protein